MQGKGREGDTRGTGLQAARGQEPHFPGNTTSTKLTPILSQGRRLLLMMAVYRFWFLPHENRVFSIQTQKRLFRQFTQS